MTFGEKLSKLRKEKNFTQEQLAEILCVSRQSISKWESDISYPETDKLIKMGKIFDCSMDYFLNEDINEKRGMQPKEKQISLPRIKHVFCERKSEKIILGMPLYHIGKNARGFFALGMKARGVFSIGLLSRGIVSLGLLSYGLISFGVLTLGLISAGILSIGLIAVASIAIGIFAAGAISVGIISFGALSVGCFSAGALAIGEYAAIGDHAYAAVAIGKSAAEGSVYRYIGDLNGSYISTVINWLNSNVPSFLTWAKEIFIFFIG